MAVPGAAAIAAVLSLAPALARAAECAAAPAAPFAGPRIEVPANVRVGLALGSGSMHGLAHIGIVRELEARGLRVDVVSGTSIGAMVGALWASGLSGAQIAALHRDGEFSDWAGFTASWQGLFSTESARRPLEAAFRGRPIEAWPRRFGAVATNVANGERRILARGDAATAVLASSAVPVMYRPVEVAGERLVDGALVEPVPVNAARDLGATFVIGVDVAYRPHEEEAHGLTQYAFQAVHILVNSLAAHQLASADVAIRLNLHERYTRCGPDALIAAGRDAVARAWPEIRRALAPGSVRAGKAP